MTVRRLLLLIVLATSLSACAPGTQLFRAADPLTFHAPDRYATVTLPVTLSWSVNESAMSSALGSAPPAVHTMVFIDRAPMAPGDTFTGINDQDRSGVVEVQGTSYQMTSLPAAYENQKGRHEIVIVLVDAGGRRVTEASDYLELLVSRP